jgi:hypothetical protein
MTNEEHLRILQAAEEAGLVRFEGGELAAYGVGKPSAGDHTKSYWGFADAEKLAKFIKAMEGITA